MEVPDSLLGQELAGSEDTDEARRAAEERFRLLLILRRIAMDDGIEVDEQDVNERLEAMAQAHGTTPARLRNELEAGGGLGRLHDLLLAEKTLDYIIENADMK
jgi:trigger factor